MQRVIAYISFNSAFSLLSYTAGPAGIHTAPAAKVIPNLIYLIPRYSKLQSHCSQDAVPCYIHSTQPTWCPLMSSEAHLEGIQEPPRNIVPIQKGIHSGTSTMRWRQQDSSPGDQFYCLLDKSQKACCPLFQSRQGSCFVYCVFSFNWQVKLSLSQYRRRTLKSCFI